MANYKNQHFVPRCYLKPFTKDQEGRALNLHNLDAGRSIPRVSARDQCSGDYFYGDDLKLEKRLQPLEASYGRLLDRIQGETYQLNADDRTELRRFWLLQHLRTEAASRRTVEMFDQLEADAGEIPQGYRTNIKDAVKQAMSVFFDTPDLLDDLSVCLVRNTTDQSFITSDNPAVMGNRWHQSDRRAIGVSPGLQNAGMVGLLPLSPVILCLLYDSGLYTVPNVTGWVSADRPDDVNALNAHQVLNCAANLYFADWSDRTEVEVLVAQTAGRRLPARFAIHHAVLDRIEDGAEVFKVVPAAEARLAARSIVHSEALLPTPQRWPSILRWRTGGRVYAGLRQWHGGRLCEGQPPRYQAIPPPSRSALSGPRKDQQRPDFRRGQPLHADLVVFIPQGPRYALQTFATSFLSQAWASTARGGVCRRADIANRHCESKSESLKVRF